MPPARSADSQEAVLSESLSSLRLPGETSLPSVVPLVASSSLQLQQSPSLPINNSARVSPATSSSDSQQALSRSQSSSSDFKETMSNYKNALNLYCQKNGFLAPQYDCTYPEDAVGYIVSVYVNGRTFRSGTEGTKRAAESKAAALALQSFGESLEEALETVTNGNSAKGEVELASVSSIAGMCVER